MKLKTIMVFATTIALGVNILAISTPIAEASWSNQDKETVGSVVKILGGLFGGHKSSNKNRLFGHTCGLRNPLQARYYLT